MQAYMKYILNVCGLFYAVLCVFSIVTGLLYAFGALEMNPVELSQSLRDSLADPAAMSAFAVKMGWVTFVVGIVQGITAYCFFRRCRAGYWVALGFTIFSICSVSFKLVGAVSVFAILKSIAYVAILVVLLLPSARKLFFK